MIARFYARLKDKVKDDYIRLVSDEKPTTLNKAVEKATEISDRLY